MKLKYHYKEQSYQMEANMNIISGKTMNIFHHTLDHLELCHNFVLHKEELVETMDTTLFFILKKVIEREPDLELLNDQNFRKDLLCSYEKLQNLVESIIFAQTTPTEEQLLVYSVFSQITNHIQEIVQSMLEEHTYQEKIKYRNRKLETGETVHFSLSFEDTFLQMTDLANVLQKVLTEKQRDRLVKHLFMGYSITEIAQEEGVHKVSISESISSAYTTLKKHYQDNCK